MCGAGQNLRTPIPIHVRARRLIHRGVGAVLQRPPTRDDYLALRFLLRSRFLWKGLSAVRAVAQWRNDRAWMPADPPNPLQTFFDGRREGRGITKWRHYFDIYQRHFGRLRGREVHVLEIGVYAGGSLEMWRDYFGPRAHVYGVDIQPACKRFESDSVRISIGDQADRDFWKQFKRATPALDVVIDDGGHAPQEQIVAFEELLPFLRSGGIYLVEDIHGICNGFAMYVQGFAQALNAEAGMTQNPDDNERSVLCRTTALQSAVASVHLYPFVAVVERTATPVVELVSARHGTQWEPF